MLAPIHQNFLKLDEQDFYTKKTCHTGIVSPVNSNGDIDFLLPRHTIQR